MLARTDLRGRTPTTAELRGALPRGGVDVDAVLHQVRPVVEDVRDRGAAAALDYSEKFDGVRPDRVRVPKAELDRALEELDPAVRSALVVAIERTRTVHQDQRRTDTVTEVVPGGTVTERWVPVERVGLYVPGGNAVYPSSVVMNVVPAQAAGVESLVVASPPQADFGGLPHPTILAAAALLGVEEVWAVGGAQAVALLSYGGTDTTPDGTAVVTPDGTAVVTPDGTAVVTPDGTAVDDAELAPVDMITGPGNIYVTAAKRLCRAVVGIDAEAGPTEIAIPDWLPDSAVRTRSRCLVSSSWAATAASTASASSALVVSSTEAAMTSCSAWLIMSAATWTGSAVWSARIAISVGPASASMPTTARHRRLAAVT